MPPVDGRQVDIDHLQGRVLLQDGCGASPGAQGPARFFQATCGQLAMKATKMCASIRSKISANVVLSLVLPGITS